MCLQIGPSSSGIADSDAEYARRLQEEMDAEAARNFYTPDSSPTVSSFATFASLRTPSKSSLHIFSQLCLAQHVAGMLQIKPSEIHTYGSVTSGKNKQCLDPLFCSSCEHNLI